MQRATCNTTTTCSLLAHCVLELRKLRCQTRAGNCPAVPGSEKHRFDLALPLYWAGYAADYGVGKTQEVRGGAAEMMPLRVTLRADHAFLKAIKIICGGPPPM